MEILPPEPFLEHSYEDVWEIRRMYNFEKLEDIREAIDIIEEWLSQQNHIVKKNFSRRFIEATILSSKGSLEKTKMRIDKLCTFKTLLPKYFGVYTFEDLERFYKCITIAPLPKKAPGQNRIEVIKAHEEPFYDEIIIDAVRVCYLYGEYMKVHDVADGFIFVCDYRKLNILNAIKNINLMDLRHGMTILIDGLGCNVRGIHLITSSTYIELLINLFKQTISEKIAKRVFVHKDLESLHEVIPQEILPKDLGGKEESVDEIHKKWMKIFFNEEHTEYMRSINECCTDESLRMNDAFKDEYMGMPGTFRTLHVD
ncbi:CRAL/TRIO domain-containing protein [Phthorimaea operculella]|nr:CRAL/TRIO domain-containing protein [Phthorimaea operculella]